jgi:hypothetical protein
VGVKATRARVGSSGCAAGCVLAVSKATAHARLTVSTSRDYSDFLLRRVIWATKATFAEAAKRDIKGSYTITYYDKKITVGQA